MGGGQGDKMKKDWGLWDSQDGIVYLNLKKCKPGHLGEPSSGTQMVTGKNTADREPND